MDWGSIIMDTIIASIITGALGIMAVLITNTYANKRGYDKIDSKIGEIRNTTLSGQHENIQKNIELSSSSIKNSIQNKLGEVDGKVNGIGQILVRNEERYLNLNVDQKEIRNNVSKLLYSWEMMIKENQELKHSIDRLTQENRELKEIVKENDKRESGRDRERERER